MINYFLLIGKTHTQKVFLMVASLTGVRGQPFSPTGKMDENNNQNNYVQLRSRRGGCIPGDLIYDRTIYEKKICVCVFSRTIFRLKISFHRSLNC